MTHRFRAPLWAAILLIAAIPVGRAQTVARNPHGTLPVDCSACHRTADWFVGPRPPGFDHDRVGYPLVGQHIAVTCRDCHDDLVFSHVGSACIDCHTDIHRGQNGSACERCHSPAGWENRGPVYDQHAARGFPLIGSHAAVDCEGCHLGQQRQDFARTPVLCVGCHETQYDQTGQAGIPHAQLGFGTDCSQCHTPTSTWGPTMWDHLSRSGFALAGHHATINCVSCHKDGHWSGLPRDCFGCHGADYAGASEPPHGSLNFPHDCAQCHDLNSWGNGTFDHAGTGFTLTGAHVTTACTACHANGQWAGLPQDCWGCHAATYNGANDPPHASLNFPHECTQCHTTSTWGDGTFDHTTTGFALTGAHVTANCASCHANGQWAGLPQDCWGCHTASYNGAADPPHASLNFPHDCTQCHTTSTWGTGPFDHSATGFTLTGAHVTASCTSCHANGQWTGLPQDCWGCHTANYNGAADPPHAELNFPHDCTQCHTTSTWGGGAFDHTTTGFALTGAHVTTSCTTCHANGQWTNLPQDCFGCHAANYNGAADPPHAELNFPHDCTQCHTTSTWGGGAFDHTTTGFALTGAHVTTSCTSCHANGQWAGLPQDCYSCHAVAYNSTTDPPHASLNFPHDCTQCHTTSTWGDGAFDHAATGFALTGTHVTTSCTSCHANGQWAGLPQDCYSCHTIQFTSTTDPPHQSLNFPHDCTQCHTTSSWGSGTFDHTTMGFVLTGAHTTVTCTSCHANGQWAGLPTDCYSCHTAQYSSTTDPPHQSLNFPHDCTQCHTTGTWGSGTFDHATTGFVLTGAHTTVTCTSCHANGQWAGLPTDCYSCHTAQYNSTTDPPHQSLNFPHDCTQCHTTSTWGDGAFDHAGTGFTLTGAHATVNCTSCHANGQWAGLPTDCYSCHVSQYNSTIDPPHQSLNFPHDCTQCHTTSTWGSGTFDHAGTGFALTGAHVTAACTSCHANGQWAGLPNDCFSCHSGVYNSTTDPPHASLNFPHDCTQCHTTSTWGSGTFDHAGTGFTLTGAHVTAACTSCHANGQWAGLPNDCFSCHSGVYNSTTDPPHASLNFPHDCTQCHTTSTWGDGTFDHAGTGFALTGAHTTVPCTTCHANGQWAGLPQDCYGCHASSYNGTNFPPHGTAGFATTCRNCHNTAAWQPATWDHGSTGFSLTGAHVTTDCTSCHANGQWPGLPQDCYSCHAARYNSTTDPPHQSLNFPHDCTQCHTTSTWGDGTFDHTATGFALTGAHTTVNCTTCHANGQWVGLPPDCYGCHAAAYNGTNLPPHGAAGFSTTCHTCHNTAAWQPSTWSHATTGFTLTGAHGTTSCTSCHANGQWAGLPQDCYSCHVSQYNSTTDPPHQSLNFPHDCTQCHTTSSWGSGTFNHTTTGFALTGAHTTVTCTSCHANGQWAGLPQDCYSCHVSQYNSTTDPPHQSLNFPHDCTQCHTTSSWGSGTFNHTTTGFALTGAHTTVTCTSCHANGQWAGLPQDCYSCHVSQYNSTTDPPHQSLNFPHDCTQCHSTSTWGSGTFDHAGTGFALTGAHTTVTCTSCHANGQWAGLPQDCYSCHTAQYNSTTDPPHQSLNFPHDCTQCHTTSSWGSGTFDHTTTGFALTGAHVATTCTSCHANGQWAGLPTDCYGCHAANYNGTTNPQHAAALFPTTCQTCHTTTAWTPSTWNHDPLFPIYSGNHQGVWTTCATCHVNPSDYSVFECILCHTHNQSTTNGQHTQVTGYQYLSTACYGCHPNGRAGD